MEPTNCAYCQQPIPRECICKAVAKFFADAPGASQPPAAPSPKPIALRSLQRLAAGLLVAFAMASVSGCGQLDKPIAVDYVAQGYANPRCEVLQGPNGVEIVCPNGGYGFVRYRAPGISSITSGYAR